MGGFSCAGCDNREEQENHGDDERSIPVIHIRVDTHFSRLFGVVGAAFCVDEKAMGIGSNRSAGDKRHQIPLGLNRESLRRVFGKKRFRFRDLIAIGLV